MRLKLLATTALVVSGVITTAFFVGPLSSSSAQTQTRPRYLPEYTAFWRSDPAEEFPRMGVRRIATHSQRA